MRARVVVRHSPPFSRRGGCAINKKIPFLSGADGVVNKRSRSLLIDIREAHLISCRNLITTPSAPLRNGIFLLMAQPPLLENGGEWTRLATNPIVEKGVRETFSHCKVF